MNLLILVKIGPTVIEILTFNKWSSKIYRFQKRVTSTTSLGDAWRSGPDLTTMRSSVLQLLSGEIVCVRALKVDGGHFEHFLWQLMNDHTASLEITVNV